MEELKEDALVVDETTNALTEIDKYKMIITRIDSKSSWDSSLKVRSIVELDIQEAIYFNFEALDKVLDPIKGSITDEEVYYFTQSSNVPRYKVTEYNKTVKSSVTRSIEKATKLVISDNYLDSIKNDRLIYHYELPENEIDLIISDIEKESTLNDSQTRILNGLKIAKDFGNPVYVDWSLTETTHRGYLQKVPKSDSIRESYLVGPDDLEDLTYIINNQNLIVKSEVLINRITSSAVIDYDMYMSMTSLFESSDSKDHVLAFELLTNCNYEKSLVYILVLLKNYHAVIKASCNTGSVTSRGLFEYLGITQSDYRSYVTDYHNSSFLNIDDMFELLNNKSIITQEISEFFSEYAVELFNKQLNTKKVIIGSIKIKK